MSAAPAAGRYLSLAHWRGFAALWVLVFHANRNNPDLEPAWLGDFVTSGWLGVQVFFVVSGYCITERACREYRAGGSAGHFLLDRLLRIFPPYWAALAVAIGLNVAAALLKGVPLSTPVVLPAGLGGWLTALTVSEVWFGQASFLLVAWTLSYEIGFYLLSTAALWLALRSKNPRTGIAAGGALFVAGLIPALSAWHPLLLLWPQFAVGGAVWLLGHWGRPVALRLGFGTLLFSALWLLANAYTPDIRLPFRVAVTVAWLLLVLRIWDEKLAAFAPLRWLGWVGGFSYSLYLVHAPLVGKFANLAERWPPLAGQAKLIVLLSCAFALPCAWLFYRFAERKSEEFRRNFLKPTQSASA